MNPDPVPAEIGDLLEEFTLAEARRLLTQPPDLIVFAEPDASSAGAGVFLLLTELSSHFSFRAPAVAVIKAGYGAYFDLLGVMHEAGLSALDTATHQGLVVSEQRRFLRRALRARQDVGRLTVAYAGLQLVLAGLAGDRVGGALHVQVMVDIDMAEDPRPCLVKTVVHAAAPSICRVVFTIDPVFPALGFWQAEIVGEAYDPAFVARYWDRQDLFDPDMLAALDAVIAERVRAATAAWLPGVIETLKRQPAG